MILTNKQAHLLLYILQDSLKMNVQGYLSISYDKRYKLLVEILEQQDDTPVQILKDQTKIRAEDEKDDHQMARDVTNL